MPRTETPAARERRLRAEALQSAAYGDREAKQRYLRLSACADEHAERYEALAAAEPDPEIKAGHENAAANERAGARAWRRRAREASRNCGRNLAERRKVLGRRPAAWEIRTAAKTEVA